MRRELVLLVAAVGSLLPLSARVGTAAQASGARLAVLPFEVNGVSKGEVTAEIEDGDVRVRVEDLERSGVRGFAGERRIVDGQSFVSLASLAADLAWTLDLDALELSVTAAPKLLGGVRLDLGDRHPRDLEYSSDASAFLNYSVTADQDGRSSGFSELGWNTGRSLVYSSVTRTAEGRFVRGLTNLTVDDRDHLVRWVVGDTLAVDGDLAGSALLAGISVSRNFGLDPYFFRFPGFGISGAVTRPTRADVYVNGRLVRRENLQPGSFDFSNLPVESGSGETRVVLRDALGGERVLSSPFYFSTSVLAAGLSEFSYSLGFRRESVAARSVDYGDLAFLGHYRRGLTDRLTVGVRGEAQKGLASGGASATAVFQPGEIEFAAAASAGRGSRGGSGSVRVLFNPRHFNTGGYLRWTGDEYETLSLSADRDRPVREVGLFAGAGFGRRGSVTLDYAAQRWRDSGEARRLAASYGLHLSRGLSLNLSAARTRSREGEVSSEISITANVALGGRRGASANLRSHSGGSSASVEAYQSPPRGVGLGYRLQAASEEDGSTSTDGRLRYNSPFGIVDADYARHGEYDFGSATLSGSVVAIGGSIFASRPIQDGFGLIRVPGLAGVRGTSSHQGIGRTNARGDLLVPDLLPYYGNVLGITADDIPVDFEIGTVERVVAPPYRGGAVVRFPVHRLRATTGRLRLNLGGQIVVPSYGLLSVEVRGGRVESTIGHHGDFYLEDLSAGRYPARVTYLGVRCEFWLEIPASAEAIVRLDTLTCTSDTVARNAVSTRLVSSPLPAPFEPVASAPSTPTPSRQLGQVDRASAPTDSRAGAARMLSPDWTGREPVYVLHFSSFRTRQRADRDASRLAALVGLPSRAAAVDLGEKGVWFRVVLGEFGSAEAAKQARSALSAELAALVGGVYRMEGLQGVGG